MSPRQILNSWKEIAKYLGRGVRTAQRYEAEYRLPVHRPAGRDRSAVLAFSDELDAWLAGTPKRVTGEALQNPKYLESRQTSAIAKMLREQAQAAHTLSIAQSRRVRAMIEKFKKDSAARNPKK